MYCNASLPCSILVLLSTQQRVQELLRACPRLRRHAVRVAVDFLAVVVGFRPAFLLDYAHGVPVAALAAACQRLNASWSNQHTSERHYAVLSWQGLLWVVNCNVLHMRLRRLLDVQQRPNEMLLITFGEGPHFRPRLQAVHESPVRLERCIACLF